MYVLTLKVHKSSHTDLFVRTFLSNAVKKILMSLEFKWIMDLLVAKQNQEQEGLIHFFRSSFFQIKKKHEEITLWPTTIPESQREVVVLGRSEIYLISKYPHQDRLGGRSLQVGLKCQEFFRALCEKDDFSYSFCKKTYKFNCI